MELLFPPYGTSVSPLGTKTDRDVRLTLFISLYQQDLAFYLRVMQSAAIRTPTSTT